MRLKVLLSLSLLLSMAVLSSLLTGCPPADTPVAPAVPTNTPAPTGTPTFTPSFTPSFTITQTPTITNTPTITHTSTHTGTPTFTHTACPYTQGKISIGASSVNAPNIFFFLRFAPSSPFTANYLHYYVTSGASGLGAMAIYAHSPGVPGVGGSPSTVIGKTALNVPVKDGWNDLPITQDRFGNPITNVALSAGVTYWLAFVTNDNSMLSYDNVGGYYSSYIGTVWVFPNFNADPGQSGNYSDIANYDLSLYASDCP